MYVKYIFIYICIYIIHAIIFLFEGMCVYICRESTNDRANIAKCPGHLLFARYCAKCTAIVVNKIESTWSLTTCCL